MDVRSLIETGIVSGGFLWAGLQLYEKAVNTFEYNALGFLLSSFILLFMHQILPQLNPSLKRSNEVRVKYRQRGDSGLWCCLLFPGAWVAYGIREHDLLVPETCVLLLTTAITIVMYNPTNASQAAGAFLFVWLKGHILQYDGPIIVMCAVFCTLFYLLLTSVPNWYPRCFTEGELATTLQIILAFCMHITMKYYKDGEETLQTLHDGVVIAFGAFIGVMLASILLLVLHKFASFGSSTIFYLSYFLTGISVVFPVLMKSFGSNVLSHLYYFMSKDESRVRLLIAWSVVVLLCIIIMFVVQVCAIGTAMSKPPKTLSNKRSEQVKTDTKENVTRKDELLQSSLLQTFFRKFFHVVVVFVFLSGIFEDPEFLYTSSVVAMGTLFIFETIRCLNIWPLGAVLQTSYAIFRDKQDEGCLLLTPLYLLAGMSLPLWICKFSLLSDQRLLLSVGVLSVGVGDAIASIAGQLFGHYRWPGTLKHFEGTVLSIVSQWIVVLLLQKLEMGMPTMMYFPITMTALLETFTFQIDNLILPLYMFIILCAML